MRIAISEYAFSQGQLAKLYDAHGVAWDQATASKLVEAAARQIGASVEGRGETSYALTLGNGVVNSVRVYAVHKYLSKLVQKMAAS